jgi:hypothetical protein
MIANMVLMALGVVLICLTDLRSTLRSKNKKSAMLIVALVAASAGFAGANSLGLPSPLLLLHAIFSPLGRVLWGS